ncbi:G-type lectin S-receptor-like serine/threonine-protein kinase [Cardamine amara subsp. amara]|uniref:Receptor-like serine/threonine-protein kinase n=1 Tax=Cardamine amara subsp. amara TaxID=228776 RepID=A0ABD1C6C7_CARAN
MVSFFFTLFFFLFIHGSSAVDTISANFTLSGDQTITSAGGTFEMGFFKPGPSSNFYIGMWYKQLSKTILWVANRDKPVNDKNTSVLKISNGNLILLDGKNQTPVWSTGLNSSVSSLKAVLQDDGNLVLRVSNDSNVLWQSFDHPGNTWLPGVKIRLDRLTGKTQRLISWKNPEDPSPGLFSLELDKSTAYKILWNGSNEYWSSGPWNPQTQIFDSVPEMRLNYIYNFSFFSNATESYFTYSIYSNLTVSRFVMDVSGQIKQFTWIDNTKQWNLFWSQPRQQCQVYRYCGSFGICSEKSQPFCRCPQGFRPKSQKDWDLNDYSAGCVRRTELQCSNGDINQFLPLLDMKLADESEVLTRTSLSICASACQGNCSCVAYAHNEGLNQCLVWSKDVLNLQKLEEDNNEGNTFYLRLAASDIPKGPSGNTKSNKAMIFGAVIGSLGVIVLVLLVVILVLRYRRRKRMGGENSDGTLAAFSYRELQNATKNFSEKLGGGGFGSVFKGALPDSSDIAVKRLEGISQGEKQFRTEVVTIGTIQHVNLVRLRGFCSEGNKKLLVYDYMPNGSLDSHLFLNQNEEKIVLEWKLRYQIALGTARGLAYLHDECRDCIIHCDIKPENILLDSQFCPKVADFGLAKLVGRDFSRVLTTMRGTRGYLAPEWISGVAITAKADVYSFGMMLLEIVSGRRNTEQSENEKVKFFPSWAATILTKDGDIRLLLDPRLEGNDVVDIEELMRACKVACWCIQDEESHRPTMSQVVQILEGVLEVNLPPFPRSIQALVDTSEDVVFFTESSSSSSHTSSQKQSHSSSSSSKKSTNNNSSV